MTDEHVPAVKRGHQKVLTWLIEASIHRAEGIVRLTSATTETGKASWLSWEVLSFLFLELGNKGWITTWQFVILRSIFVILL